MASRCATFSTPAGPLPGAAKVRLHGVDNYTDTIPLAKAMDPTTLVAFEMNGERLPDRHGFPARVVVPGYFGEKNVKWLTRIELTGPEAEGFYEKQGWGPDFKIPTRSRIDQPNEWEWFSLAKMPEGDPAQRRRLRWRSRRFESRGDGGRWQKLGGSEDRLSGHEADLGNLELPLETGRPGRIPVECEGYRWRGYAPASGERARAIFGHERFSRDHGLSRSVVGGTTAVSSVFDFRR